MYSMDVYTGARAVLNDVLSTDNFGTLRKSGETNLENAEFLILTLILLESRGEVCNVFRESLIRVKLKFIIFTFLFKSRKIKKKLFNFTTFLLFAPLQTQTSLMDCLQLQTKWDALFIYFFDIHETYHKLMARTAAVFMSQQFLVYKIKKKRMSKLFRQYYLLIK